MKRLAFTFFLLIFCLGLNAQVVEKTFLRTDKDLYAPGDTLWFKGYVFNRYNTIHDQGLKFNVFLFNEAEQKISDSSWPIYNGMTQGYVPMPNEEGRYHLVAYTPDMMNLEVENNFNKEIFVRSGIASNIQLDFDFDKEAYEGGDALNIDITGTSINDKPLANERFTYEYLVDGERVKKGRYRTDDEGKASIIGLEVPNNEAITSLLIEKKEEGLSVPYRLNTPIPIKLKTVDLQFFPESGKLVKGINSKVAFKAVIPNGEALDFAGVLLNAEGQVLDTISSYYQGMGAFFLRPTQTQYQFKIIEPKGIDIVYSLPEVVNEGSTLSVLYSDEEPLVKASRSPALAEQPIVIRLQQHDMTLFSQPVKAIPIEFIRLPTELLDIGTATLSLVAEGGQILAERLIFNGREDQLKIDIAFDKPEYLPRDLVKLKLKVTDKDGTPIQGNFSFSVVDDTYSPLLRPDSPNLMAQLLLQSELKGKVPTPNFYFSEDEQAATALDLVMLTHGWRNYELITNLSFETITGQLVNKRRKKTKLSNREISVFDLAQLSESLIATDEEGNFNIPPSHFKYKGDSFLVAAKAQEKKEKPLIRLSNDQKISHRDYKTSVSQLISNKNLPDYSIYRQENKVGFDRFRNTLILNTVDVFGQGLGGCELRPEMMKFPWKTKLRGQLDLSDLDPLTMVKQVSSNVSGFGNLAAWKDGVYIIILQDMLLSRVQKRYIKETDYGRKSSYFPMWYSVRVNCEYVGEFGSMANMTYGLGGLDLSNVASISVLDPEPMSPPGKDRGGRIFIKTIDDKIVYRPFSKKFFTYALKTEQEAEFYSPKYDSKEKRDLEIPDLRTTIHWEHTIITNENGEAEVQFYNADRDNRIRITVEGLGSLQRFGFAQKDYRVLMPAIESDRE